MASSEPNQFGGTHDGISCCDTYPDTGSDNVLVRRRGCHCHRCLAATALAADRVQALAAHHHPPQPEFIL